MFEKKGTHKVWTPARHRATAQNKQQHLKINEWTKIKMVYLKSNNLRMAIKQQNVCVCVYEHYWRINLNVSTSEQVEVKLNSSICFSLSIVCPHHLPWSVICCMYVYWLLSPNAIGIQHEVYFKLIVARHASNTFIFSFESKKVSLSFDLTRSLWLRFGFIYVRHCLFFLSFFLSHFDFALSLSPVSLVLCMDMEIWLIFH